MTIFAIILLLLAIINFFGGMIKGQGGSLYHFLVCLFITLFLMS